MSNEGCTKRDRQGGFCFGHGVIEKKPKRCEVVGCTKKAAKGGCCVGHGGIVKYQQCGSEGCTKYAVQ